MGTFDTVLWPARRSLEPANVTNISKKSPLVKASHRRFRVRRSTLKINALVSNKTNSSGTMRQDTAVWKSWNGPAYRDTQSLGSFRGFILVQKLAQKQPSTDNYKHYNG